MLRENLQLFLSLSILFISTNSLHLNNRIGGGGGIGIGNNIVASSTGDNNIDDINDDTHSFRRRSPVSSASNLDYIDPRLNNRILFGEHYKKLSIGGGDSGGSSDVGGNSPTHKLFDENYMKFNHIKTTNTSTPSRHYSFGYVRNLDNVIPDIDDDIDIIDDNDYNHHHHRPILIGLNQQQQQQQQQQHYHPKHNYQYGNIPMFIGDSSEMLLKNNEFPPLTAHFNRRPPLSLPSAASSSSILHAVPSIPTYAMINGNRNRYEHDNYGYILNDKIPKKYTKNNDDLIDIDNDRNNDNNKGDNNNNDDDGMINDERYDYRKRRNNKNKKNNNQSPPKALQELFQQNGENSLSSSSSSSSSSDNGKNGNNINNRQAPLDIRLQSNKQQIKMRQDQQQKQQQQQNKQTKKQIKQNENKQKKLLQMEQLKQIKRSGSSGGGPAPQMMPSHSIASQLMLRTARGQRQYDVPQIECPSAMDGMERFACPTPDRQGRYRCIDDHVLCDGFIDCPEGEDEDRSSCMFYKTTKAHLDVLADALLRWARGR